ELEVPADAIAACTGLEPSDVLVGAHKPVMASVGIAFVIAEVTGDALTRAAPDLAKFRSTEAAIPALKGRCALHLYVRDGKRVRARMFAPLSGTIEDPATGSANATLGPLLLSLTREESASYEIIQGVEMGRPSLLRVTARRTADGIRSTVSGGCVPVLRGEATV
ncbi:MAG: PhzF family phenazine biosynthesis protein, partial [Stellaceae bacterium]